MTNEEFWNWADAQLKAKGSSYYRAEMDAGLGNAAISRQARNWSTPTLTACKALAQALDLPIEDVLRMAGHLPPDPSPDHLNDFNDVARDLASLPDGPIRDQAMAAIRAIARDARRRSQEERRRREPPTHEQTEDMELSH